MSKEMIQEFFSVPFNRYLFIGLAILGLATMLAVPENGNGNGENNTTLTIEFFNMPGCPHCADQKIFHQSLIEEYPNVKIVSHNIAEADEFELFSSYYDAYQIGGTRRSVPLTLIGDRYVLGFDSEETTGETIKKHIDECIANGCPSPSGILSGESSVTADGPMAEEDFSVSLPIIGTLDLSGFSLPVLAIILGLIDGFNPCAMWVLVYMIALLLELKDPKRMWLIVGVFLLSSGILYFLFMTAWLNVFLFLGYVRVITVIVGCAALGFGILNLKEYYDTKGVLVCKVTDAEEKQNKANKMKEVINAELTIFTFASIVALAFAVNSIEFVCSAALPAVFTQILALADLPPLLHYAHILLYVLFFMLDDLVIFSLAAMAVSRISMGEKYVGVSKIIGGAILLLLGLLLLFAPNLLR